MATSLLPPDSDTLSPIPDYHRRGLICVVVFSFLSFVSTTALFLHLTYKLVRWHIKVRRRYNEKRRRQQGVDLSLGLAQRHFGNRAGLRQVQTTESETARTAAALKRPQPNQFVILIYNLFLADIQQSMAFLLNTVWVSQNSIEVGTTTCWAQGWFVSTGDLSSSMFITAIATHTYMTVAKGYKPPQWALYTAIVLIWAFVYVVSLSGIAKTKNGQDGGGYYVRAAAWCWVNEKYENLRLLNHYLFIFISLAVTSILYTLIFFSIRSGARAANPHANPDPTNTPNPKLSLEIRPAVPPPVPTSTPPAASGHHPGFLVYPIIYVVCTLPLCLGRIATMAGANVPIGYFCAAGALIVSNGWLDALLWGTTRRTLVFGPVDNTDALGLDTFTFMRTPADRRWGNMVWVQGATDGIGDEPVYSDRAPGRRTRWWNRALRIFSGGGGAGGRATAREAHRHGGHRRTGERSISQESLRGRTAGNSDLGMAIQLDTVTTVVVEVDDEGKDSRPRRQESAHSVNGSEKKLSFQV
ncbi:G protein-coupled glucose receptor regulating Gpa2-domain-containing protein [Pleurostoma richardsiae]|uniref:G protein-coupled glucose receptor regulating Gpa2-domain-containing protein n=1 Tax=Pleurostoma richardsiae TaxID=41990 RepID=A0AA38RII3_9PEZI|nr:G protein-coupled glucose receptor regulating Gpa2-domain-containing protein [Pleurostoma richardsiae]